MAPNRGGAYVRKPDLGEMGEVVVAHRLAEALLGQSCRLRDPPLLPDLRALQWRYAEALGHATTSRSRD